MRADKLLRSPIARELYEAVRELPIIDYHNHLELSREYGNITELWLDADPYKHRLMRIAGVDERLITGDSSSRERFDAWCRIFPELVGTPVYTWCLMELERFFGTELIPSEATADALWELMNAKIAGLGAHEILSGFRVEYASPVGSVLDDVSDYRDSESFAPSLRADDALAPTREFIERLERVSGKAIDSLEAYLAAIASRLDDFVRVGCKFVDHALDDGFIYVADDGKNGARFADLLEGREYDKNALFSCILTRLGGEYARRGLTMQIHFGALRKTSTRLRELAGAAGGYAAIGRVELRELVRLLDAIERTSLPRTMLFPLDPTQLEETAVLSGSFSRDGERSIVSLGPAWWWCDHRDGIRRALDALSSYSALSTFIGMTTDSRSLLSFVRHDYFRRTAAEWLAEKVECGEYPEDIETLIGIMKRLCYTNAKAIIGG